MPTDDELRKLLHDTLERQYDLVWDRRKILAGQASQLMTFAGIIQTILVGLLVALATNPQAKSLLSSNPNYSRIVTVIDVGFAMYILTAIMSIIAYFDPRWLPAPVPIPGRTEEERKNQLEEFYKNPQSISMKLFDFQLSNAVEAHRVTNKRKYGLLVSGYGFLLLGITFTAIAGYLLAQGIASP